MLQNLIEIFRIGELLPQKRFPINSDNRKLRNASNHIYRHIVKLFVGFLSHVLSTPIRRIALNAHGICSFICSMDNIRAIRIHHGPCFLRERDGGQQIEPASRLVIRQNASARLYALSALSCIYISITYFVTHAACSIAKECTAFYISAHPRLRLRPEMQWASFLSYCCYE